MMKWDARGWAGGLTFAQLAIAAGMVAVTGAVLLTTQIIIGPNTATSGFLTILFLLPIVRATHWRGRILAAVWSLSVALLGYAVGGVAVWATLIALVAVSLLQGFVIIGEIALLTRSPVNLLAFASLSQSGGEVWHILLGALIGTLAIFAVALASKNREPLPEATTDLSERALYGVATAIGSVVIVTVSTALDFPFSGWALLTFCIILSVGADRRLSRSVGRIMGSVVGAVLAVVITSLPTPAPIVIAVVCIVLCVAYVNNGNYTLFVLFLTPGLLLTTATEHSYLMLGVYRLEAVLFATVVALVCSAAIGVAMAKRSQRTLRREHDGAPLSADTKKAPGRGGPGAQLPDLDSNQEPAG